MELEKSNRLIRGVPLTDSEAAHPDDIPEPSGLVLAFAALGHRDIFCPHGLCKGYRDLEPCLFRRLGDVAEHPVSDSLFSGVSRKHLAEKADESRFRSNL